MKEDAKVYSFKRNRVKLKTDNDEFEKNVPINKMYYTTIYDIFGDIELGNKVTLEISIADGPFEIAPFSQEIVVSDN